MHAKPTKDNKVSSVSRNFDKVTILVHLRGFELVFLQKCVASMQVFWVQTFLTQRLPSPNFFKLSVPGGLRIFRAFASLFIAKLPLSSFLKRRTQQQQVGIQHLLELDQVKIGGSVPGATLVATDRATATITQSVFKTMFAVMITAGIFGARQSQLLIAALQVVIKLDQAF